MAKKKSVTEPAVSKKVEESRTRNFTALVYPDSAPEHWQDILSNECIPAFISPLHDKDINEATGEPKKPHYHVIIMFEGPKSELQAKKVFDKIGGVCPPDKDRFAVQSIRGASRYLCHLDNPEKAQYDTNDVRCLAGADYWSTINLVLDKYIAIGDMMDWCVQNKCYSYSDLILFCRSERFDWFRVLCDSGTFVIREFLKSLKWTEEDSLGD